MPKWPRRGFLYLLGAGVLGVAGVRLLVPRLMRPGEPGELGDEAAAFVEKLFAGIDRSRIYDGHVHVVGLGVGGTGCTVNPDMLSHLHPIKRFQFDIYRAGAGISNDETADADYVSRLLALQRTFNPRGKLVLLAFDYHVDEQGNEHPERSPIYTPNDYVLRLAAEHESFVACVSVHPYRVDAIDRLDAAVAGGARAVKWLPNAMGIDPASPRCDAFYRRLAELRIPLIAHAGKEYAVDSAEHQDLGNPQRLRRALDAGARVVVAHCASLGSYRDLDAPVGTERQVDSFDLFMRMFTDEGHADRLYADISTLVHTHHELGHLRRLLEARELHSRLIYASDYPLPALRFMISPRKLQLAGLLTSEEVRFMDELFAYNPLLFNFAVNRAVRHEKDGRTFRFSDEVFESAWAFEGLSRPTSPASPERA